MFWLSKLYLLMHQLIIVAKETHIDIVDFVALSGKFYLYIFLLVTIFLEQGPILEKEGISIGIVMAIVAPASIKEDFEGNGGHARAVLMLDRNCMSCPSTKLRLYLKGDLACIAHSKRIEVPLGSGVSVVSEQNQTFYYIAADTLLSFSLETHEWMMPPDFFYQDCYTDCDDVHIYPRPPPAFLDKCVTFIGDKAFGYVYDRDDKTYYVSASRTFFSGEELMKPNLAPDRDFLEVLRTSRFTYMSEHYKLYSDYIVALQDLDGKQVLCIVTYGAKLPDEKGDNVNTKTSYIALSFFDIPGNFCTSEERPVPECNVHAKVRRRLKMVVWSGDTSMPNFGIVHILSSIVLTFVLMANSRHVSFDFYRPVQKNLTQRFSYEVSVTSSLAPLQLLSKRIMGCINIFRHKQKEKSKGCTLHYTKQLSEPRYVSFFGSWDIDNLVACGCIGSNLAMM
ncbi:hypothetical protein POM88_046422 [Heracleum sosnowskyi]|uniref:Uncharacterized protein n=1 Tax=Heracleum sosnowskyi TaxID=360622 RepID=A0AAD8H983_9APIA|nr:hypothetical protein POM88_046422 [Heracleum sosnowskyi]